MSKPLTLEKAARNYAAWVEYRKRLTEVMNRCRCSRQKFGEYDDSFTMTSEPHPSCGEMWHRDNMFMEVVEQNGYRDVKYIGPEPRQYDAHTRRLDSCREERESIWCTKCERKYKLRKARHKAFIAESNTLRGLLNAAQREKKGGE